MSFATIRPATIADKDAICRVHYEALTLYHEFYGALFSLHPKDLVPILTERAMNNSTFVFLVAELEGSVVGFIRYSIVEAKGNKPKGGMADDMQLAETSSSPPAIVTQKKHLEEIWERFSRRDAEMDTCKEDTIKGQRHFYPNYQRQGIGGKLLSAVLEKADADGVPTLIVSSAVSHGLYLKMGFEDLGLWTIDNGYWAQEIVNREMSLGIQGNEELGRKYEGVKEMEACMIRRTGG
ncbi:hypothetical protein QQZ08_009654 [Neonectria magnoliae]|uniref:N-acetyltransferase domain-containing protein n=1 Tax=Neonectria magnoliae TaxID=2732573 RepID=A0ABR1HM32_9HYPO